MRVFRVLKIYSQDVTPLEMVGRKVFFSEEKKQKTFATSCVGASRKGHDSICKSLLVLFFRKEHLPS
jgi:hypothetical protein